MPDGVDVEIAGLGGVGDDVEAGDLTSSRHNGRDVRVGRDRDVDAAESNPRIGCRAGYGAVRRAGEKKPSWPLAAVKRKLIEPGLELLWTQADVVAELPLEERACRDRVSGARIIARDCAAEGTGDEPAAPFSFAVMAAPVWAVLSAA